MGGRFGFVISLVDLLVGTVVCLPFVDEVFLLCLFWVSVGLGGYNVLVVWILMSVWFIWVVYLLLFACCF